MLYRRVAEVVVGFEIVGAAVQPIAGKRGSHRDCASF
jgi:hypothetical protein